MSFEEEIVDIVDENDSVIGSINRKDEIYGKHILRSASIYVINSENKLLLQLRSKTSPKYPLHWDMSGAGHVDSGESYENCAKRELFEEVGLRVGDLEELGKHQFTLDGGRKRISVCFKTKIEDLELNVDTVEVADAKWFSLEEIRNMLHSDEKFHPENVYWLKKYFL